MHKVKKWLLLALPGLLGFAVIYIIPFFETITSENQKNEVRKILKGYEFECSIADIISSIIGNEKMFHLFLKANL